MTSAVTVISSMATRQILSELVASYRTSDRLVEIESVGGVDAARRVRAGERFDVIVLAADAMTALCGTGDVIGDSVRVFARSPTAVAVPAGVPHPAHCDEAAIRTLVGGGVRIGLSTGPSGKNVSHMLQAWGVLAPLKSRIVQAPAGVPVARLLASGDADVGFQQLSELLGEPGIEIVGTLPPSLQPMTIFCCGIGRHAADTALAKDLIDAFVSSDAAAAKRRGGMEPAA
jgi:molybdate transport system substrate-binding protein